MHVLIALNVNRAGVDTYSALYNAHIIVYSEGAIAPGWQKSEIHAAEIGCFRYNNRHNLLAKSDEKCKLKNPFSRWAHS